MGVFDNMKLSARARGLKTEMLAEKRYLSVEQAKIIHRVHCELSALPLEIRRAEAFSAATNEIEIKIARGELICGNRTVGVRAGVVFPECGLLWLEKELAGLPTRPQDPFLVREEDRRYIEDVLLPAWSEETLEAQIAAETDGEDERNSAVVKINQKQRAQGHIIPDVALWLKKGPSALLDETELMLERRGMPPSQVVFYKSVAITLRGALSFIGRYSLLAHELLRDDPAPDFAEDLRQIEEVCFTLTQRPPRSFHEALQSVWFLFCLLQLESNAASFSAGRIDRYLLPFYENDVKSGVLTRAQALELVECFFLKFNQICCMRSGLEARYFAGFPIGFNLVIGGRDENGALLENELSYLFLAAQKNIHLPQPNLSARLCDSSSDEFLTACATVVGSGGGLPQFFNDESIIPALQRAGLSPTDAAGYGIVGCVELAGCGNMLGWSNAAMFNVIKVLELTLNHGICLLSKERLAPDFGGLDSYKSYGEFEHAFALMIEHFTEITTRLQSICDRLHGEVLPTPFLSCLVSGCMEKALDVTRGGAKYNSSGIQFVQAANLCDSLAVLKYLVFEGKLPAAKLLSALQNNFADSEIHNIVLEKAPKYGNDNPAVDALANKWIAFFEHALSRYKNARDGDFHIGLYTVSSHLPMGENVGASPDGRRAGEPLADGGISASHGCDRNGPSAVLKSAAALDSSLFSNGSLLNLKFSPSMFESERNLEKFVAFLKSFVDLKIDHVQFNVVSRDELLDAQKHPQAYRGLIIRVAGYTAFFTELDRALQSEIIRRTECII